MRDLTLLRMMLSCGMWKGSVITSYKYSWHVEISWLIMLNITLIFILRTRLNSLSEMWCFSEQVAKGSKHCGATVLTGLSYQTCAVVHTHITYLLTDSVQRPSLLEEQIPYSS